MYRQEGEEDEQAGEGEDQEGEEDEQAGEGEDLCH